VGYDGETIAFVEIRTRTVREDILAARAASLCQKKACWWNCAASADCHLHDCPTRFDVLAIDNIPGRPPEIGRTKTPSARNCASLDNFVTMLSKWHTIRSAGLGHPIPGTGAIAVQLPITLAVVHRLSCVSGRTLVVISRGGIFA
jgi:Holliday junction resolvase-like predicted endonuclease